MSSEPAFSYECDFDTKKDKTRLIEHFDSNDKKRTAKSVFFEDTDSVEKLCHVFSSFLQAMKTVKATETDFQGHFATVLDTQATEYMEELTEEAETEYKLQQDEVAKPTI